jgi:tRNA threonylcarbamoyladenosine biosynthesis protein TsaE
MRVYSLDELGSFTKEIIGEIGDDGVVLLKGDLAAGKTTFVREFVKSLGLYVEVSSPTFSILNEYENRVCHYDIYQNGIEGFLQSGLLEKLDEPKYHLIEWADKRFEEILTKMGFKYMKIEIETLGDKRGYTCTHSK